MNKNLSSSRSSFLNTIEKDTLGDVHQELSSLTKNIETSFKNKDIKEVQHALDEIDDLMEYNLRDLARETLQTHKIYKKAVKEKITATIDLLEESRDELEDIEDDLNDAKSAQGGLKGFFHNIASKAKKILSGVSQVKNVMRVGGSVLSAIGLKNHGNEIKNRGSKISNKFRSTLSNMFGGIIPSLKVKEEQLDKIEETEIVKIPEENEWITIFPEDKSLLQRNTLGYQEAYTYISDYYDIKSTAKGFTEDGSSRKEGRTCLEGIQTKSVIGLRNLARYMSGKGYLGRGIVTGATELGHGHGAKKGKKSHYNGDSVDLNSKELFGKNVIKEFGLMYKESKTVKIFGQEVRFYYHGEGEHIHLHIEFGEITNPKTVQNHA